MFTGAGQDSHQSSVTHAIIALHTSRNVHGLSASCSIKPTTVSSTDSSCAYAMLFGWADNEMLTNSGIQHNSAKMSDLELSHLAAQMSAYDKQVNKQTEVNYNS